MTEPMTDDPTDAPEDAQQTPQEPAQEAQESEAQDEQDPAAAARREAASYRRRLRDTEAERDRLAERVTGYMQREVEVLAEQGQGYDRMAAGSDLWTGGVQLADVLDDEGAIDAGKVQEQVAAVLAERPHWRKNLWGSADVGQGPRQSATPSTSWSQVLGRTS